MKYFYTFVVICFAGSGIAQARIATKKHIAYLKLIEAYTQRTLPGIRSAPPQTASHFIIVWEGAKSPETFFWRGDNGWLPCNMVKVHKVTKRSVNMPPGMDYTIEKVAANEIQKGDTLQLTPVAGGKFPVPGEIPDESKNTLFFKTGGSAWLAFAINNITKKQDIAMP